MPTWPARSSSRPRSGPWPFRSLVVAVLVITVLTDALPVLTDRLGDFLGAGSRTSADETGVFQGLRGTFWIGVTVTVLAFPIGISAAIYLEEYAAKNRFARFIDVNIRNLAGVPSVVYGILGFTIFVKLLDGFFPNTADAHAGKTTLAAGLTLAVLVLPIVIITSAEAIRAVPQPLREAGYGVGATKWEVIRHHVLPYAAPGILTGTLLSLARALGEAAPILLVGAVEGRLGSQAGFLDLGQLGEQFTAMPALITTFAGKPGADWVAGHRRRHRGPVGGGDDRQCGGDRSAQSIRTEEGWQMTVPSGEAIDLRRPRGADLRSVRPKEPPWQ